MHIKDKSGAQKEWNFPSLGKGSVDFPRILEMLNKAHNNCPLSVEIEFTKAGPKDLAEVNQAMRDSFNYLQGLKLEA